MPHHSRSIAPPRSLLARAALRSLHAATVLALVACQGTLPGSDDTGPTGDDTGPTDDTGTEVTEDTERAQSGSRLKRRLVSGADGSQVFVGFQDTELGLDCSFATTSSGAWRCLPTRRAQVRYFYADSECTEPLGWVPDSDCAEEPQVAYTAETCAASQWWEIDSRYTGQIYEDAGTFCEGVSGDDSFTYYRLGAPLDESDFVLGTLSVE